MTEIGVSGTVEGVLLAGHGALHAAEHDAIDLMIYKCGKKNVTRRSRSCDDDYLTWLMTLCVDAVLICDACRTLRICGVGVCLVCCLLL